MSLLDVIFNRRSVRRYKSESVPEEVLSNILEAGRLAPSANNAQPWHFIVVTDKKVKHALAQGRWNWFIEGSAFTIVGCGDKNNRWSTVNVSIALENMVIAAESQGVGSCWIGDFKEDEVMKLLGISDSLKVVALVSFGYPAEKPSPRGKKSLKGNRALQYILDGISPANPSSKALRLPSDLLFEPDYLIWFVAIDNLAK